ncbi:hypothetical protein [Motilimonas sp. E26]|nr:hypothetical protein [Motilimonas sp. E26]
MPPKRITALAPWLIGLMAGLVRANAHAEKTGRKDRTGTFDYQ